MVWHRNGMTLMEALILLAIAVVILGLLAQYLLLMRETAGQAHCANNLRLIGMGFHQGGKPQEGGKGPIPPACISAGYATWAVPLAPYLAAQSPLNDWDARTSYFEQPAAVREAALLMFFCPSRPRSKMVSTGGDIPAAGGQHVAGAVGDYAGAAGDGDPRFLWDSAKANGALLPAKVLERQGNLILRWQARTTFADLKRGLSNTILVGEKHVPWGQFGQAQAGDGSLYNGGQPANFIRVGGPGFGLAQDPADPLNNNFGSYHPGICQFLMADNSVRPLANAVAETVLGQLIRRD